jgi:pimeloyl-ACP methyl ester carboxylesterase
MASFVLIHGAWSGGFRWRLVRPILAAAGHDVFTPSLTGLGDRVHLAGPDVNLTTHIDDIVNLILYEDLHDVVLVGASYGGMPVTGAAHRMPDRIAHLLYVDAFQPRDGESCWDLGGGGVRDSGDWRIPPPGQPDAVIREGGIEVRRSAMPIGTLSEKVRLSKPLEQQPFTRTYIKATADPRPEPPRRSHFWEVADRVSKDPAWRYIEMNAHHGIPWENPRELADILLALPVPAGR